MQFQNTRFFLIALQEICHEMTISRCIFADCFLSHNLGNQNSPAVSMKQNNIQDKILKIADESF